MRAFAGVGMPAFNNLTMMSYHGLFVVPFRLLSFTIKLYNKEKLDNGAFHISQ
jgi:hypothetical protein